MAVATQSGELEGVRVALVGLARTGMAAAPVLRQLGAQVVVSDQQDNAAVRQRADELTGNGFEVRLGATPAESLAGAQMVIPSPGIPREASVLALARERGLPIYSEIEIAYRISKAPILAVTGTNGKTTCAAMLAAALQADGRKTWLAGNISADEVKMPLIAATAQAGPDDAVVAEVSSFQLEWVDQFRPKVAILTNITPDHLNRHTSFAEYAQTKARIFARQGPDDIAVLKAVDARTRTIAAGINARPVWFDCGSCYDGNWASVQDGRIVVCYHEQQYRLCRADALRVVGTHNLENALAVAGAAIAFGASADAVAKALADFPGVPHRMEFVDEVRGVRYINNSMCTNVEATIRSLEAVRRPTILIAGGSDKNANFAPLGAAIKRCARRLILIGDAADAIAEAARSAGFAETLRADSLEQAVTTAASLARPGDAVLLAPACASFGMFRDFEERGQAFRDAVRSLSQEA